MPDLAWGILIGAPCWILIGMVIMSVIQTARQLAKPDEDSRQLADPEHRHIDERV
ncbi:hypothetical protein [Cohnella lubricantis]|uniref:Uncharacterized protein n=1 Tax=Cohnella lubricantis TaxID=2163172 RepID=A0A841T852_9BACL|nr:hypothetical protein [Cohnella lubricantis]MBB6677494.1 hypothetical protein [Cohnella lubricantis]MBP2116620.1 hypothetical protein [Cohnella lubricantis]